MGGRDGILGGLSVAAAGEDGGEALVEALDGQVGGGAQQREEALGFLRLRTPLSAQGDGKSDHDPLGTLLAGELEHAGETRFAPGALDDRERPRDGARGIGDGDTGPCGAVVEREDLHRRAILEAVVIAGRQPPAASSTAATISSGRLPFST